MYLKYYLDENNQRVYTLSDVAPDGSPTSCAHPARFNPKDQYSSQRIRIKARFGLLPTQKKEEKKC
ncbi:putative H/ACA ribonucleoprotein complex subunit 3 [Halyomorpha halys]|uniref:putative H/ACA ribonucleoprotein complex subunit 3 n=1 Tax=Halyomorpha halys TaxID=286706 RepID=UPI0006D51B5C|nr:putative H/ACA ribonucleoprotein complex subunit 3 [Halyomorpha halys]